ncbi:hypothetical protein Angca_004092, partial [Angiostrongylus cantonensis]
RDGKKLEPKGDFQSTFDGVKALLTVRNLTEEKTGLYKCHAVCKYGEGQSSAMIKMEQTDEEYPKKSGAEDQPQPKQAEKKMSSLKVTKESDDELSVASLGPTTKRSKSKSP